MVGFGRDGSSFEGDVVALEVDFPIVENEHGGVHGVQPNSAHRQILFRCLHRSTGAGQAFGRGTGEGGGTYVMHGRSRTTVDPRIPTMPGRSTGRVTYVIHGRSRTTIDTCIPTTSGRSTSDFYRPGRHCLHRARSVVRWPASCILHPTKNRLPVGRTCIWRTASIFSFLQKRYTNCLAHPVRDVFYSVDTNRRQSNLYIYKEN